MLKSMLVLAALTAATPAMATEWMLVGMGGQPGDMGGFVIDRDSIVAPTPDTRRASMYIIGYNFAASGTIEIDCPKMRWHSLGSEVRIDGAEPVIRGVEDNWSETGDVPNMGAMLRFACGDAARRSAMDAVSMGGGDPVAPVRAALRKSEIGQ